MALEAIGTHGFALAGAGALVAHGLISRPTEDLDLFSPTESGPGQVSGTLQAALTSAGYHVTVLESAEQHGGEFVRLQVDRDTGSVDTVQVDVARDWRQHPPVRMQIGPVLHLDDAVASKVAAMIDRGLPRDYIDVAAALHRYDRNALLRMVFYRDPGLRVLDVALAVQLLDRLPDAPFVDYGLTPEDVQHLRQAFEAWPRDAEQDTHGQHSHAQAHQADNSAARQASAGFPLPLHDALQDRSPAPTSPPQDARPDHTMRRPDLGNHYRR